MKYLLPILSYACLHRTGGSASSHIYGSVVLGSGTCVVSEFGQKAILLHNSQYCLGSAMDTLPFKPNMHSSVAIGLETTLLVNFDFLGHFGAFFRTTDSLDVVVVATL